MSDVYLEEYSAAENVKKYVSETAGHGISYILEHIYGPIYSDLLKELVRENKRPGGLRLLEYGCGGGMNLHWMVRHMRDNRMPLDLACGTDFSAQMTEAATRECAARLGGQDHGKVVFHTVANENLARELPGSLGRPPAEVLGSFDLIVGVNTYRYCFRLGKQAESAQGVFSLLRPGGYTVMIEMNRHFPFFRSKMRNRHKPEDQTFLPTLEDYDAVFRQAGFEIVTSKNFCWIPHSASPAMTTALHIMTPVLDALFRRRAMRSLIVARRPR